MALVRVTLGGKRLGYVRNNKAGSTTIINYLGQLLWNEKPTTYSGTNVQNFCGKDSYIGRERGLNLIIKNLKNVRLELLSTVIQSTRSLRAFIIVRNNIPILITWMIFYGTINIT